MKLQKDVESRHRLELEAKQEENERLASAYYEAKRVAEVLKAQVESLKSEGERELRDTKERHRQELQELTLENQALLSKAEDRRDRDLVRQLRRELDDSKRRCTELTSEATELRRERDALKLERSESHVKFARELEDARNERRVLESEAERLSFKTRGAEEER
jgi:predicted  nucleic acid-binding Zn-ribbon protein